MGGADAVLEKARRSFAEGDYRWVAEVLNHVVMHDPGNGKARALLADTYEQLGYQAESGPWRNFYLCGALELRADPVGGSRYAASEGMARGMPLENLFQTLAVRLNGPRADGVEITLNLHFSDIDRRYLLQVKNAVLHALPDRTAEDAEASIRAESLDFKRLMLGLADPDQLIAQGRVTIDGDAGALARLGDLLDTFERRFPIVTPRPGW
jgi:alkyl sulfatase BDS1-like metallo-beta-lactamase superfamily hydrolase